MSTTTDPFPSATVTTTFLHVKITVDPTNIAAFLDALKPAHELVTALPEFVSFNLYHSPNVPGEFEFVETWDASMEWALKATEEEAPIRDSIAKMVIKPEEVSSDVLWGWGLGPTLESTIALSPSGLGYV